MGLETSGRPPKLALEAASGEDSPGDRFWTNFGLDFGRGSEDLNQAQMGPEVEFKEAYASKMDSETIWNRFGIDFGSILDRPRALS